MFWRCNLSFSSICPNIGSPMNEERGLRGDGIRTAASSLLHASSVFRSGHNGKDRRAPPKKFVCLRRRHGRWPSARCDKPPTPKGEGQCRDTNGHAHTRRLRLGVGTVSWAPGGTRRHASRREVPSPGRSPVARRFAAVCAGSRGCVSDTNGNRGICLALAHQRHSCRATCSQHDASTVHCHSRPVAASGRVCHSAACEGGLDGTEGASGVLWCCCALRFFNAAIQRIQPIPNQRQAGPAAPPGTRFSPRDALDPSWSASRQQRRDRS